MKQVQQALKDIGIPVIAGVWRASGANQNPPPQYCVYSTTTVEAEHEDDHPSRYRTYVYLNLWSETDPTEMRYAIRNAMYAAGFGSSNYSLAAVVSLVAFCLTFGLTLLSFLFERKKVFYQ